MATTLIPDTVPDTWSSTPASVTMNNGDPTGNDFALTGQEIVYVKNEDVGTQILNITSVACAHGRTGNIAQSMGTGAHYVFPYFTRDGWMGGAGRLAMTPAVAGIKIAVLRLPRR